MKTKIYYITRSFAPYQKGGGPLMRTGAVKYLKKLGWNVTIVMPNFSSNEFNIDENIIQIPLNYNIKMQLYLERLGFREDYLDIWVKDAFEYLKDKINKEDILFTTSGGELGMIKLGSLLKEEVGCKFVVNFRDPLGYSIVDGRKQDNKFHVSREKQEKNYLKNSNFILTSSSSYKESLQKKYSQWKNKIENNYFGYIDKLEIEKYSKIDSKKLRVAYVGNMGALQSPEILYDLFKKLDVDDIEIYFIGDITSNKKLQEIDDKNIKFIDFLPHSEFLKFMIENIDVGFVSLTSDYLGACVPSKIYEYINLGLPILGALPNGDGKDIVNDYNYGIAFKYDDMDGLKEGLERLRDAEYLENIKENVLKDRDRWFMENMIKEVNSLLKDLKYAN